MNDFDGGTMSISIAICTRNRRSDITRCLDTLLNIDLAPVKEIIILDQSDQPLSLEHIPASRRTLLRYAWRKGRGLARARNQAVALATGDIVAFTDDDCFVTTNWAVTIERLFREHPDVDGVFGRVLAYGDQSEITYHQFKTAFGEITYATRPGGLSCSALIDKPTSATYNRPIMTLEHLGSGNNMAFRRTVFEHNGLFAELLGAGAWLQSGEDIEFHYRLLRAHHRLMYTPDALLYHDRWMRPQENESLQHGYTVGVIATYLYFGLRGDRYAWNYFKYRFSTVKQEVVSLSQEHAERKPRSYYTTRARAFAKGIAGGIWLALTQRHVQMTPQTSYTITHEA